jgi:hypothetical protein
LYTLYPVPEAFPHRALILPTGKTNSQHKADRTPSGWRLELRRFRANLGRVGIQDNSSVIIKPIWNVSEASAVPVDAHDLKKRPGSAYEECQERDKVEGGATDIASCVAYRPLFPVA